MQIKMKKLWAGEISEPVLTSFGYHIIKLDARKASELQAFDVVKDQVLAEVRRDYVNTVRSAVMEGIFRDPTLEMNQPAIDALVTRIDADAIRKAGALSPR